MIIEHQRRLEWDWESSWLKWNTLRGIKYKKKKKLRKKMLHFSHFFFFKNREENKVENAIASRVKRTKLNDEYLSTILENIFCTHVSRCKVRAKHKHLFHILYFFFLLLSSFKCKLYYYLSPLTVRKYNTLSTSFKFAWINFCCCCCLFQRIPCEYYDGFFVRSMLIRILYKKFVFFFSFFRAPLYGGFYLCHTR